MLRIASTIIGASLSSQCCPSSGNNAIWAKKIAPGEWPENRYDMIWVFDLQRSSSSYKFRQVPQELLAGDLVTSIK